MRNDLLGYLLGALDDAERVRVESALQTDPQLRRELAQLRAQLAARDAAEEFHPPEGLREQTCDLVEGCQQERRASELAGREARDAMWRPRFWSLTDSLVAAALFVVAAMLFFPAIANSRFRSHVHGCQRNLQYLSGALGEYSQIHNGVFPAIPVSGNRAAAGIYGPLLVDGGFVLDTRTLVCPGSLLSEQIVDWRIPTLRELDHAQGRHLDQLRRAMGGSYGYTLGYTKGDRYLPSRNEGRAYFALMSDAPSLHLVGRRSSNHCGRGQNVLFEDGHIEFIVDQIRVPFRDALFLNRNGFVEAGVDRNDAVIGSSATPPILLSAAQ